MDITTIRGLARRCGPFASVYFDSSHDTEDAGRQLDLRWRAIQDQLAAGGATEETLAALDTAVAGGRPSIGKAGRGLLVAGGDVLVDEQLREPPAGQIARVSPLPYVLPLLELAPPGVPHAVAVVDRTGADLRAVGPAGTTEDSVRGRTHEVAREVSRLVDESGAQVLVLAGEARTRTALRDALPPKAREITTEIDTGGPTELDAEVNRVVAASVEQRESALLSRFRAELARGGLAVEGLAWTAAELLAANVEYLLVDAARLANWTVYAGGPTMVATTEDELRAAGVETIRIRRADEALPVAALAGGARIVPVGDRETLMDGVGALLRHA